jgi:hypothetical protein
MVQSTLWPAYKRVPPFLPVPLRGRADGWTVERQGRFIGLLAQTGSVAEAAREVGMSRESAWRLRRRAGAESFAHAWDMVTAIRCGGQVQQRKITPEELPDLAFEGPIVVCMRRRMLAGLRRKPSNSALLRHLRRLDAVAARGGGDWSARFHFPPGSV